MPMALCYSLKIVFSTHSRYRRIAVCLYNYRHMLNICIILLGSPFCYRKNRGITTDAMAIIADTTANIVVSFV